MGKGSPINAIKSPSDGTLYAPAFADGVSPRIQKHIKGKKGKDKIFDAEETNELISNFIKQIRLGNSDSTSEEAGRVRSEVSVPKEQGRRSSGGTSDERSRTERARDEAADLVLKAERYKAELAPEGMFDKLKKLVSANQDDKFFHIICHIDQGLRDKIKKGEFVDLEKLLIKHQGNRQKSSGKIEIVNREGSNKFDLIQNEQEGKITNVNKWEQAFRLYATVYTKEHPHRSAEILQYMDTIHRAARTFNWEAVADYDFCFRQLMAEYPERSWATIYTQMWNLTLCESGSDKNQ